jgi:hypothetical protein
MADDLATQRAKNSAGFLGENPPEAAPDPLLASLQALNKRLNAERIKENAVLEAAQRKAFGQHKAPKAQRLAPRRTKPVKSTPKNGD